MWSSNFIAESLIFRCKGALDLFVSARQATLVVLHCTPKISFINFRCIVGVQKGQNLWTYYLHPKLHFHTGWWGQPENQKVFQEDCKDCLE